MKCSDVFKWAFFAVLGLVLLSPASVVSAEEPLDEIWVALVLGTSESDSTGIAKELRPYKKSLKKVFGYKNYQIKGAATRPLAELEERWLIPSDEFYLKVIAMEVHEGGGEIYMELYQGKRFLVKMDAKVSKDQPLFIRGPGWGDGRLIIVVVAR